jgi:hypothetical protein
LEKPQDIRNRCRQKRHANNTSKFAAKVARNSMVRNINTIRC